MSSNLSFDNELLAVVYKHRTGQLLSEQEQYKLEEWLAASEHNRRAFEEILDDTWVTQNLKEWDQIDAEAIWNSSKAEQSVRRIHFIKTAWFRYAAAVLLIIAGLSIYYLSSHHSLTEDQQTSSAVASAKTDVAPGYNRAILTLSNGETIALDSAATETIADGALSIKNKNGRLIYQQGDIVALNTMTTPKGGQYQLTLADGTRVWLNAASSIIYPTAFAGKTREVTITGEAYFEVTKHMQQPFIVITPKEKIIVLGTQFNVNVYADEPVSKTSLVEGAVKIDDHVLRPGQAYMNGKIVSTNIGQDVAWKNGAFDFSGMGLDAVFRQLERWYNVEVKYAGEMPAAKPAGQMGRDFNLSQVLRALKKIGINTRLEGNTLIVLPN